MLGTLCVTLTEKKRNYFLSKSTKHYLMFFNHYLENSKFGYIEFWLVCKFVTRIFAAKGRYSVVKSVAPFPCQFKGVLIYSDPFVKQHTV